MPKQLSALFFASFLVNLANAAISTMLGILIANEGGSQGDVSFIAAAYSIGFGVGCFAAPNLARRSGVIRTYAAAAAIATITIIGLEALDNTFSWAALRFVMGASIATVLAVSDTWINHEAPKDRRGQVIALYSIILGLASIGSQVVFLWMGSDAESLILYFGTTGPAALNRNQGGSEHPLPDRWCRCICLRFLGHLHHLCAAVLPDQPWIIRLTCGDCDHAALRRAPICAVAGRHIVRPS